MINLLSRIQELSASYFEEIQGFRHHLHANPELSFEEFETSKFVQEKLTAWGIPFQAGVAGTGVVGLIKGDLPGENVFALRGDMDALPIFETNDVPYKSTKPGIMHACGHDVHTSCLLGAAKILNTLKPHFGGTIKLIFQPAEERLPGGANLMIQEGVLENPRPNSILGQHVMPLIPAGKVGFRPGMYMASADEITLTIRGKGGHAAMPHLNIDTVLVTSHIIVALQQVVSRAAEPSIPSVLSFGKVTANGAYNIIPNEVEVLGTFRTMNEEWREKAHAKIHQVAEGVAASMGASCEVFINKGYPFLCNDEPLTNRSRQYAVEYLGEENVIDLGIWMAAEDFAWYSHQLPACFYRLGTGNVERGITSSVHTPTFDIDESALPIGMGLMAYTALKELGA